ncbi:MAG TPA: hypothetical protein GX699_03120 [Firmicutes bacterium]|nr:hypothetical protein [Bacillota bacterium]
MFTAAMAETAGNIPFFWRFVLILLPLLVILARAALSPAAGRQDVLTGRRSAAAGILRPECLLVVLFILFALRMLSGKASPAAGGVTESILPLVAVALPFAGALLTVIVGRTHAAWRDALAASAALLTFGAALSLYPLTAAGTAVFRLPEVLGLGLCLQVDFFGFLCAVLASLIWFLATFYSQEYMEHEHGRTRYYFFLLLSLGGTVGVFLAGELLSLFLFFETMTLASYVLVVHTQSKEAMAAGRTYLYMGVFGGLCLLAAVMLLFSLTGTTAFAPNLEAVAGLGKLRYLLALLFFLGFGIKAGAVPLHIWLPQAHPVAPTPASALLSGIMIKAGAYGLIRVYAMLFVPADGGGSPLWTVTAEMGYILIWIGIVTMFAAAVLALVQTHAKRVLAYSSVSQMGYILMGLGAAAYLGYEGAMGLGGLVYHIINHAFFKAGMFLMVGAVYLRTHDLNYDKLGGLWRRFPLTALCFLIAGAAISGFPGFNGYISKTLLHHAIVEAFEHQHVAALLVAEKIFVVTGGLTFCYILRLFTSVFLGTPGKETAAYRKESGLERAVFGIIAAVILYGGLFPGQVVNRVILPLGRVFSYDPHTVDHLAHISFFTGHDLAGIAQSLAIGLVVFLLLKRVNFRLPLPAWLSVEQLLYRPFLRAGSLLYLGAGRVIEFVTDRSLVGSADVAALLARGVGFFDSRLLPACGHFVKRLITGGWEKLYQYVYTNVREIQEYAHQAEWIAFITMIKVDYNPRGDEVYRKITMMNLDLTLLLVMLTLAIVFSLRFLSLYAR